MVSFIISIILLFGLQFTIVNVLRVIGITSVAIEIISDLIFSIVFAFFDFRGREKLRNPAFHSRIAIYFIIMTLLSLLLGLY